MARYIDADALRKKILNTRFAVCYDLPWNRWWINKSIGVVNKILEIIKEFPSADVEEVKHGEWIEGGWNVVCSSCGVGKWKGYIPESQEVKEWMPRCPNCGAKMDGKESGK